MSRISKILLNQWHRVGWDNEALWAFLGVLSMVIILEVYLWGA
jgi:hypothetical protein